MINEIDYNHRVFGAYVDISTGNRDLKFRSYNQRRLRKLIGHVQHCMAEIKKKQGSHQESQNQHLEQINGHLQTYLVAQHKHQVELQQQLQEAQSSGAVIASTEPPRPSPELSDYLLAHGLMAQYQAQTGQPVALSAPAPAPALAPARDDRRALYDDGIREVFGSRPVLDDVPAPAPERPETVHNQFNPHEINAALRIAYSKLPMLLHHRKFGHPSLPHPRIEVESIVQPQLT